MSLSDGKRRLLGRLQRRKTREREGLVLVEGARATVEALVCGARPRFLLRSPRSDALWSREVETATQGLECHRVSDREMAEVAGTESPQGLLLVAEEPRHDPAAVWDGPGPRVLVLDGVQDPGNVGTLIRAAAAFGCSGVAALDGTADAWGARAVRAAAGTTFRLPVLHCPWPDLEAELRSRSLPLLAADAGGTDIRALRPPPGWALVVGGEGSGCRSQVRARADHVLCVAMPGGVESLNVGVAGAILLHELTRAPLA